MNVQLFTIVLLATAVTGYHKSIGIPAATTIRQLENTLTYNTRITYGLHSFRGLHPFFGGLIISLDSNLTSVCGSSLITNTKLVTAAHCWYDGDYHARYLMVVLGSDRLFSGGTRIVTNTVATHDAYQPDAVHNDIAIITIPTVDFSVFIKPIRLPEGSLLNSTYEGRHGVVVGYGRTSDSVGIDASQTLRFGLVTVSRNEDCNVYGPYFGTSMICSNAIFSSPCGGDSGGPLYVFGDLLRKHLIGVVSYGSAIGCNAGYPNVYTRISSYIDWIKGRL